MGGRRMHSKLALPPGEFVFLSKMKLCSEMEGYGCLNVMDLPYRGKRIEESKTPSFQHEANKRIDKAMQKEHLLSYSFIHSSENIVGVRVSSNVVFFW